MYILIYLIVIYHFVHLKLPSKQIKTIEILLSSKFPTYSQPNIYLIFATILFMYNNTFLGTTAPTNGLNT